MDERPQQRRAVLAAADLEAAVDAQSLVVAHGPGRDLDVITLEGRQQVVDLRAPHGHPPTQAAAHLGRDAAVGRMRPGAVVEPGHIDGIVDVPVAVDLRVHGHALVDEGCRQVPAHVPDGYWLAAGFSGRPAGGT